MPNRKRTVGSEIVKRDIVAVDYIDKEGEKHRVVTDIPEELAHKYNFVQWAARTARRLQDKGNKVIGTLCMMRR